MLILYFSCFHRSVLCAAWVWALAAGLNFSSCLDYWLFSFMQRWLCLKCWNSVMWWDKAVGICQVGQLQFSYRLMVHLNLKQPLSVISLPSLMGSQRIHSYVWGARRKWYHRVHREPFYVACQSCLIHDMLIEVRKLNSTGLCGAWCKPK